MGARIVVIEDHPVSLKLMSYLLGRFGHEVHTASDGRTGVDLVHAVAPDLVLCDIQLPGLDGFGVLAELQNTPVPVVAMTALAMVGDRERILAAGFDGYVSKPIDARTFAGVVDAFLPAGLRSSVAGTAAE